MCVLAPNAVHASRVRLALETAGSGAVRVSAADISRLHSFWLHTHICGGAHAGFHSNLTPGICVQVACYAEAAELTCRVALVSTVVDRLFVTKGHSGGLGTNAMAALFSRPSAGADAWICLGLRLCYLLLPMPLIRVGEDNNTQYSLLGLCNLCAIACIPLCLGPAGTMPLLPSTIKVQFLITSAAARF